MNPFAHAICWQEMAVVGQEVEEVACRFNSCSFVLRVVIARCFASRNLAPPAMPLRGLRLLETSLKYKKNKDAQGLFRGTSCFGQSSRSL